MASCKAKVLAEYPDAVCEKIYDMWQVKSEKFGGVMSAKASATMFTRQDAWRIANRARIERKRND